ncbi:MAG: GNAT family N-acetyltransferase [Myxococcales bacterium]
MLRGRFVKLEPLSLAHVPALRAIAPAARESSPWGNVPGEDQVEGYVARALAMEALPFAICRAAAGVVVGCTRVFALPTWDWQPFRERAYDACEIGYTWLAPSVQRTAVNTETKLLLLGHAFEAWRVFRVTLKTDERNEGSRAAIARLGAHFDGILRAFQPAVDGRPRNTAYFTILDSEWPAVKARLQERLALR